MSAIALLGIVFFTMFNLAQATGSIAASEPARESLLQERMRARNSAMVSTPALQVESDERARERLALLTQGEAALALANVDAALGYFERAASMRHSADSEMGLIRTYMQAGHYRRALAFSAHTAGAHADAGGAAALHAWLLWIGGQQVPALKVADAAATRGVDDAALRFVRTALQERPGLAGAIPLAPPVRLAPYAAAGSIPAQARWHTSGTVVDGGRTVLIPAAGLRPGTAVWVRDGLGQEGHGRVGKSASRKGFRAIPLDLPLPADDAVIVAPSDPFPGSVIHAVEYADTRDAVPHWPWLRSGFAGPPDAQSGARLLGIELPAGARGGPVFDAQGRLAGMVLPGVGGANRLLLPSEFSSAASTRPVAVSTPAIPRSRPGIDEIYERSLRIAVQVYTTR